jgi:hypothetical protein
MKLWILTTCLAAVCAITALLNFRPPSKPQPWLGAMWAVVAMTWAILTFFQWRAER